MKLFLWLSVFKDYSRYLYQNKINAFNPNTRFLLIQCFSVKISEVLIPITSFIAGLIPSSLSKLYNYIITVTTTTQ